MLAVLPHLVRLHIKAEMEYRGSFIIDRIAQIITYSAFYASFWVLLARFSVIGGWTWPEFALLLSFQLLVYAFGASFSFTQMRELEDVIHRGQFDTLLVKPISPWAYMVFSQYNVGYLGHIILAAALMGWSLTQVDVTWTPATVAYVLAAIGGGTLIVASMLTMIGALAFVLVRSRHLYPIFFGLFELTRYPLAIFPAGVQWLLLTVFPLGFVNYVPIAWILGKDVALVGWWGGVAAPLVGPAVASLAVLQWRWCMRRYQSGGG
jgi:ABC-2 type transport system permease protein